METHCAHLLDYVGSFWNDDNNDFGSRLYLKDLIETNHIFMKMLEEFSKASGRILVRGKGQRRKKKRKFIFLIIFSLLLFQAFT